MEADRQLRTPFRESDIELDCERFEARLSDYIEQALGPAECDAMQEHAAVCAPCAQLLSGFGGVRQALQSLGDAAPSPVFSLQLPGQLQTSLERRQRTKARTMALGLAAGAALAILLWPESPTVVPPVEERVAQWSETRREWRQMWSQRLPLPEAGPHSHARVRLASF